MDDATWLADRFETHRAHLRTVAFRMLGSTAEADDAVQEAWFRLSRTDTSEVENLAGWLTTVVSRVCLDMLRSRSSRREETIGDGGADNLAASSGAPSPEDEAVLADSIGPAMLVVLDTLAPAERLAFVLHDMFAVPFDDIAAILGKSPVAARQLASRARRRVQGERPTSDADISLQRRVVDAFLAASRDGDFEALVALLHPDVVLRVDDAALELASRYQGRGAPDLASVVRDQQTVAQTFLGRAAGATPALVGGAVGATWAPGGKPRTVFDFVIQDGMIVAIELVADPDTIAALDVRLLA